MQLKPILSSMALAAAALMAAPASAAPNTLTFQGVTFEMEALDSDSFTLTMLNADAATGDWLGVAYIKAFLVKDIGTFSGASVVSGPGSWTYSSNQLNANACSGGANAQNLCFTAGPPVALTASMSWQVDVTGGTVDFAAGTTANPHLMLNFLSTPTGDKVGSNLSQDIPAIPEPETYALMLAGLAAVGFVARRRRVA